MHATNWSANSTDRIVSLCVHAVPFRVSCWWTHRACIYVNLYRSTKRRASSARRFLASRVASVMCWCPIAPLLAASLALLATCAISLRASDAEGLTRWERGSALRAKQIGRCCVASGGLCTFAPIHRVSLAWSDFLPALCLCDSVPELGGTHRNLLLIAVPI